jgi:uridine phosphorylase
MSDARDVPIIPPILRGKEFAAKSVFEPVNLLREARRQRAIPEGDIPEICLLDPDGDILRVLRRERRASLSPAWACYHTELYEFDHEQEHFGIVGCAVGASFAVLLAEQARSWRKGRRLILS